MLLGDQIMNLGYFQIMRLPYHAVAAAQGSSFSLSICLRSLLLMGLSGGYKLTYLHTPKN